MLHKASQQSDPLRIDWVRKVALFTAEMFVFCDESGTDRRDGARRTGWAPKGLAPWLPSVLTRGKRFHLLPAITVDGMLDLLVYTGHTDLVGFTNWFRTALLPKMNPFPGPNSILVMDNASWHHDPEILRLAHKHGVLLWYLPPYSPEFNPIEAFFSDLKAFFRRKYRECGGDALSQDDFKMFLESAALKVANQDGGKAIKGHYRQAGLTFREEAIDRIEYFVLYQRFFDEYREKGTVE